MVVRLSRISGTGGLLLALLCTSVASAQEARWKQLDAQASKLEDKGLYNEALPIALQALNAAQKAFTADDTHFATALGNLAVVYEALDDFDKAEPLFQQALAIDEKALGVESADLAADLNNLATLYVHQGRFAEAESLFKRALAIDEKASGPKSSDLATDLNNLAEVYSHQGRLSEAESLYKRAIAIDEKALSPNSPDLATDLDNLARFYADQGNTAQAESLYRRALAIDEKALSHDSPQFATELNNLASASTDVGNYAVAEALYKRALQIQLRALGPENPDVAAMLDGLAFLYQKQGKYAEAQGPAEYALQIAEKTLEPEHPDVGDALNTLATIYFNQDNEKQAQPLFQRAFDNLFQQFQYNFGSMSEKERLAFLGTLEFRFPVYFSFVQRFRQQDPQLIGSMYNLLLWEKGFVAGSVANLRRQVEASGDAESIKLLNELTAKRAEIASLLNVNPPDRALWRKQIDQLRADSNDIEKSLVARSAAFAEKQKLERATWQQVRGALKPGEAAVEFARFDFYDKKWTDTSYYVALVVTPETKDEPQYIVLGEDNQIEGSAITSFEHAVETRGLEQDTEAQLPGADAYKLIWSPLERALSGATRLYISPDGILNQLPIGIIPGPDGKLLMERFDLRFVSSTKDILGVAPGPAAKSAVLIGDPLFDLSEQQQFASLKKLALPQRAQNPDLSALVSMSGTRGKAEGAALPPLPGTGVEVTAIASVMQNDGWKTSVYTRDEALKQVVAMAGSARVLHIATHGFFLPDPRLKPDSTSRKKSLNSELEDPMLRSGLYFAGANRTLAGQSVPAGLDNGILTALEAGSLNLTGTELVVLSACNTGQGDVKNGEGVFGLRRALQEAGAQTVLMSLWSVPDKETLELMNLFYAKWLAGTEKHEALKQAQLAVREQVKRDHDGRDLPFYWGAFVLVGK